MALRWGLWPHKNEEAPLAPASASLPRAGESVELRTGQGTHIGVYQARVRAVGFRRILLETTEAMAPPEADLSGANSAEKRPQIVSALPPRTPLTLSYARGEALYFFETKVVGSTKTSALAVMRPRQVTRVQRRQFYRLSLEAPTVFRVLSENGEAATSLIAGRLINLSGGGALLASSKPAPSGLSVSVRVPMGKEGDLLDVEGEVLDCLVATRGSARAFLIRVRFFGAPRLSEEDREAIVAYIYEQQRMMLRNRKLLRA